MNFGDMVGQLLREGMSPASRSRLQNAAGQNGLNGLGDILGGLAGGATGSGAGQGQGQASGQGGLGDLLGSLTQAMGADSGVGGLSRGQVGGIGALAGAILGGGGSSVKGAIGGSAMAILGTLALQALASRQQQSGAAPAVSQAALTQMTSQDTAELCLHAMVEAAKSDGQIAPAEIQRILGKVEEYGMPAEERRCLMDLMAGPLDVDALVAAIPNREVGAQAYAAALMAISVDTDAERDFLGRLARGAGLDAETVGRLHAMVGAPAA